ncbi:MAG: hypothetical protein ABI859_06720 [Pseudomonadota bacterium]
MNKPFAQQSDGHYDESADHLCWVVALADCALRGAGVIGQRIPNEKQVARVRIEDQFPAELKGTTRTARKREWNVKWVPRRILIKADNGSGCRGYSCWPVRGKYAAK